MIKNFLVVVAFTLLTAASAWGQRFAPPANWTEQRVDDGQAVLNGFLEGKKSTVATAQVVGTDFQHVYVDTFCNDYGCRPRYRNDYVMDLAYPDGNNGVYVVTASCYEWFIWQHCALPRMGDNDAGVVKREGNKYFIQITLRKSSLDKKGSTSKYTIQDLRHFATSQ